MVFYQWHKKPKAILIKQLSKFSILLLLAYQGWNYAMIMSKMHATLIKTSVVTNKE